MWVLMWCLLGCRWGVKGNRMTFLSNDARINYPKKHTFSDKVNR